MTLRDRVAKEIEQTPDALLEEILDFCLFLKHRKAKAQSSQVETQPLSLSLTDALTQLRHLCAEENYTFEAPSRQNRPNPFDESLV
jgi:hypothetical protein